MNLLIIKMINYKNKNKNKKFNNVFKTETSENKNEFKSHNKNKNKNKSETKFKKLNKTLILNNIEKKKFKVCLEYHLGNCKGPCEGLQTADDYRENLTLLKGLLKGNLSPVIRHYKEEMKKLASQLAHRAWRLLQRLAF